MKTIPQGLFITFEGPDKAGKSTQIKLLGERLRQQGYETLETREPGGTSLGEELRRLVMQFRNEGIAPGAELLLFGASRAQLMHNFLRPQLAAGKIILCDRFVDSTSAYQGGARHLNAAFIAELHQFTLQGRWPDLTFLLDLSVEESFHRLQATNPKQTDRFEDEDRKFHQRVRESFLQIARDHPQRIKILDATQEISVLAEQIYAEVARVLA